MLPHRKRDKRIELWYWGGAFLILLTLIIGGVTRLTDSGLSMVEWKPILGVVPPVSDAAWQEAFDQYREYPEYQQRNRGMNLSEFKVIYFWEYLHRMSARMLGIAFFLPFVLFLWFRQLDTRQIRRASLLLLLGGAQGGLGWYMVQSGLVDVPWVSHYRLAAHLMLAVLLFLCCIRFALDLRWQAGSGGRPLPSGGRGAYAAETVTLRRVLWGLAALLTVQVVWGAFVAGLKAGHHFNTFPLMAGNWFPAGMWALQPWALNLIENPATVQWIHRWLGMLAFAAVLLLHYGVGRRGDWHTLKVGMRGLLLLTLLQVALGILTLVLHVPIIVAVAHQAMALILLGWLVGWIRWLQIMENIDTATDSPLHRSGSFEGSAAPVMSERQQQ